MHTAYAIETTHRLRPAGKSGRGLKGKPVTPFCACRDARSACRLSTTKDQFAWMTVARVLSTARTSMSARASVWMHWTLRWVKGGTKRWLAPFCAWCLQNLSWQSRTVHVVLLHKVLLDFWDFCFYNVDYLNFCLGFHGTPHSIRGVVERVVDGCLNSRWLTHSEWLWNLRISVVGLICQSCIYSWKWIARGRFPSRQMYWAITSAQFTFFRLLLRAHKVWWPVGCRHRY